MKTFKQYEQEAKKIVSTATFTKGTNINRVIGKVMINLIGNDSRYMNWTYEKSLRDKVWVKYLR